MTTMPRIMEMPSNTSVTPNTKLMGSLSGTIMMKIPTIPAVTARKKAIARLTVGYVRILRNQQSSKPESQPKRNQVNSTKRVSMECCQQEQQNGDDHKNPSNWRIVSCSYYWLCHRTYSSNQTSNQTTLNGPSR